MLTPQSTYSDLKGFFPFEPTTDQVALLKKLSLYLSVKRLHPEVLIVKGYAGTGKTTILKSVVAVHKKHRKKIMLMAPTGRAAKIMGGTAGNNAFTIHRSLYRPNVSSGGVAQFVLANNSNKNTTFVVDEAGLISTNKDSALGHNSLLEDLLNFVFTDASNSLILVGDPAQLPPVGQPKSPALNSDYFTRIGYNTVEHTLRIVVRQALDSYILRNATQLRKLIEKEDSGAPKMLPGKDFIVIEDSYHLQEVFEQLYSAHGEGNTMIVRSNKKANNYNQGIRGRIKFQEDQISAGDQFMVVKNNYFWLPETSTIGFIANGEIGEVQSIRNIHERYGLTFCEATVAFIDYPSENAIDVILNLSALQSEGPSLSTAQNNELYEQMLLKFSHLSTKKKIYEAIKNDPYYNALQVKFSYVITCHKSQGGQWEQVIIEHPYLPDGPSPIYYKWLYTAITRATKKAYLLGFPPDWFTVS